MDTKLVEEYIGTKVRIFLKNGFKFEGQVKSVSQEQNVMFINDWKDGEVCIDISSIATISKE
jgi:small nuclear ribonucleoprotein (snRNP)-like protein